MVIRTALAAAVTLGLSLAGASARPASFDVPDGEVYNVTGIDAAGDVFGEWQDGGGKHHGFERAPGGTITVFDPQPGSSTAVWRSDAKGNVCGYFSKGSHAQAFLRRSNGRFVRFDVEGTDAFARATDPHGGTTGVYLADVSGVGQVHGFLRSPHGDIQVFNPPGSQGAETAAVIADGTVSGYYFEASQRVTGYIRHPGGTFTSFAAKHADRTYVRAMNAAGTVAGQYGSADGTSGHGFVRAGDGTVISFDPPGSRSTDVGGINARGTVVGSYQDAQGRSHGYRRLADGSIRSFDIRGAVDTFATGINQQGVIAGKWIDAQNGIHGFAGKL